MRTGGIIRIVVGVVVALILTTILVLALAGENVFRLWDGSNWLKIKSDSASTSGVAVSGEAVTGTASVSAAGIREIEVEWVGGNLTIQASDGGEIVFTETSSTALTDAQKMRYTCTGGKLRIYYCTSTAEQWNWLDLETLHMPEKELTLLVPRALMETLDELDVDSVSASVLIDGVYGRETSLETVSGNAKLRGAKCEELDLITVSGKITAEGCTAADLETEAVSGKTQVDGSFGKIESKTVSGDVVLRLDGAPNEIKTDSVSGNVEVALPEGSDFTARIESVSGEITCAHAGVMSKDRIVCGSGNAAYRFDSVSGDVLISVR